MNKNLEFTIYFLMILQYACRKTLADRRVRVRGRFARNNEICEEDHMATKKLENHHDDHINDDFYGSDSFQFQVNFINFILFVWM
jgi:hypothetical protein